MRATLGVQIAHAMPTSYLIVWYSKELFTAWLKVNECMEEAISASCLRTPYCSRRICPGIRSKQIIYEGYQAAYIAKSCFQGNPWTRQHIWNPGRLQMARGQLSVPGLLCTSLRQRSVQNPGHDLHELDIDPSCNHSKTPKFLVTLRRIESKVLLLTRSAGNKCSGRQKLERSL